MNTLANIKEILTELLDIDEKEISLETYIIRDLGAESIDLLEFAVMLNSKFNIDIDDDQIFLISLREYIEEGSEKQIDLDKYLTHKYPFLTIKRIKEIIVDIENGPVLKVEDIISYISNQSVK